VVDVIRAYHEKATFTNEIVVFDMVRDYMVMARDADARCRPTWTACSRSPTRSNS